MPPTFVVLLVLHVSLALALFVPSLLLPFAFRARRGSLDPTSSGPVVRFLLALQARGTTWIGIGLALSGFGLVATVGWSVLGQPWLLAALAIYAIDLGIAFYVQLPRLRRLLGLRAGGDPRWPGLARRQRYLSYVMAGLVGTIAYLMTAKPVLW